MHSFTTTPATYLGLEPALGFEGLQVLEPVGGYQIHISTLSTISTIRPAERNKLLVPKAGSTIATPTSLHDYFHPINH